MNLAERILIIDDEPAMRHLLRALLEEDGYRVDEAVNGAEALAALQNRQFELILCDMRMPQLDGIGFLQGALALNPALTIIMMSAYGSQAAALECMKNGAYDYISKPFRPDEILLTLKKARERLKLQQENLHLRRQLQHSRPDAQMIGDSPAMQRVRQQIATLAPVNSPVLIHGETGTGKELAARALHDHSPRRQQPFIAVNCSAIAANLVESELFGHRKGAFTGADKAHAGLFSAADNGTLFLDEIGELPLELQPKLLRVLQEGEVRPIGETKPQRINVRIVAATACDLRDAVAHNRFREDLYYRLAVVELKLPALRERRQDIATLSRYFLQRIARREQRPTPTLTSAASAVLEQRAWPGNIRELENLMERIMIFHHGSPIDAADLGLEPPAPQRHCHSGAGASLSLKQAISSIERDYISAALEQTGGNRTQAAKLLEISLRALHYKINEYQL